MLSLVTVMARADLVASSPDGNASPAAVYGQASVAPAVASGTVGRVAVPATAQSVTVVRVASPQRVIGRSSGSR